MSYSRSSEPVRFERNCKAILVPAGDEVELPVGSIGYITQALGGSFTVYVEGNLFRIANDDADAIGKEPMAAPELPDNASDDDVEKVVWQQLKTCFDPEIPTNIYDLGLIYEIKIDEEANVHTIMTLTSPSCPVAGILPPEVEEKIRNIEGVHSSKVEVTWEPAWSKDMMNEEAQFELGML